MSSEQNGRPATVFLKALVSVQQSECCWSYSLFMKWPSIISCKHNICFSDRLQLQILAYALKFICPLIHNQNMQEVTCNILLLMQYQILFNASKVVSSHGLDNGMVSYLAPCFLRILFCRM
ncbi:Hypothetical_protein [Hexamita inflata]|uniref:Hypothetical_protein n=1 Tax=Hexamita inflata TaxID=28002 RepID=A0AA86QZZ9_9EUKA|nr:Hypothetical protein HINF_LOCUS52022 [Hexamita inflata]CAI9967073.1 Hypothetical protein HINF_LOCUS54718 [Hexamita inflata]